MKALDFNSILLMSAILDKTGIVVDMQEVIKNVKVEELNKTEDVRQLGKEVGISVTLQIVGSLLKSMHKAGDEIKELISYLTDKSKEEIGEMNFQEIKQFFIDLANKEGFADFFKQAAESIQ